MTWSQAQKLLFFASRAHLANYHCALFSNFFFVSGIRFLAAAIEKFGFNMFKESENLEYMFSVFKRKVCNFRQRLATLSSKLETYREHDRNAQYENSM